ncbi:ComF family protein [Hoyosella sp. G463]|uniref:ComF family protein n=1 Tax=Lolliginicoccus lacisalsi TaxID=2742202 RepID=A0A927JCG5_9ACTN|nr:ComF family protein [Lolliginicoccus lacisalsi]MBD8506620.1 ComF family protein [Lolliginicoccus lacisalsi]
MPVWTLARHRGPLRRALAGWKEQGRSDLAPVLAHRVAHALAMTGGNALGEGTLAGRTVLIPAPSRWWATRMRGHDAIASLASQSARLLEEHGGGEAVAERALALHWRARESVGLTVRQRAANVRGRVRAREAWRSTPSSAAKQEQARVVLIDDVVTTGALLAESVRVLRECGIPVGMAMVLAAA